MLTITFKARHPHLVAMYANPCEGNWKGDNVTLSAAPDVIRSAIQRCEMLSMLTPEEASTAYKMIDGAVAPLPRFYVLDVAASMPSSARVSGYRKVAVVEASIPGQQPKRIDERGKDVARIVAVWDRLSGGKTKGPRTAYAKALVEAQDMCDRLNADNGLVS